MLTRLPDTHVCLRIAQGPPQRILRDKGSRLLQDGQDIIFSSEDEVARAEVCISIIGKNLSAFTYRFGGHAWCLDGTSLLEARHRSRRKDPVGMEEA